MLCPLSRGNWFPGTFVREGQVLAIRRVARQNDVAQISDVLGVHVFRHPLGLAQDFQGVSRFSITGFSTLAASISTLVKHVLSKRVFLFLKG